MKGIRKNGRPTVLPPPPQRSAVLTVTMRVAGEVATSVRPDGLETLTPQVGLRLGEALVYVTEPEVAARLRREWDILHRLAQGLPEQARDHTVPPTPGSYPVGVVVRLTGTAAVGGQVLPADRYGRAPAHLRVRLDRLVLEVCDQEAYRRIGRALFSAEQYLRR